MAAARSRQDLEAVIASGLAAYDDAVLARWERMRIVPEKWRCSPWGDAEGGFWVVAVEGDQALWFNHIEGGFNWSPFSTRGTLDGYSCNQTELVDILERIAQELSEHARARIPEGGVPVDVAGPGAILVRQTTYWDVRATAGASYRIHFRDKAEAGFADPAYPAIEIFDHHPLLVLHDEPVRSLYFAGAARHPRDAAERIDRAIREVSESWRGLADYGSSVEAATKRLAVGHGLLMSAPESICAVVARVLEAEGTRASVVGSAASRPGHRVLLLGRSFVVAGGFAFENLGAARRPT
jgi:hypothetical protein